MKDEMGRSSSVLLLRVQLPLAAADGRDEGGALTAAVLGQQEGNVTFWGKFLYCLLEDPREAEGGEHQENVIRSRSFAAETKRKNRWFLILGEKNAALTQDLQLR